MTKPLHKEPTPNFDGWKRITIEKARELTKTPGILIWWRPEKELDEIDQYAIGSILGVLIGWQVGNLIRKIWDSKRSKNRSKS